MNRQHPKRFDNAPVYYVLEAVRYGCPELGVHLLGVFTSKEVALKEAKDYNEYRGGKYPCVRIYECLEDHAEVCRVRVKYDLVGGEWRPSSVDLRAALGAEVERLTLRESEVDWFNGVSVETDQGTFGIVRRDFGIEVTLNGKPWYRLRSGGEE